MKRFIKVLISLIYFIFYLLPKKFLATTLRKPWRRLVILCYHGVQDHEREKFAWQMKMLQRDCAAVSLERPLQPKSHKYPVAVTFDDGFANLLDNALPYLEVYGIPACIFIIAGKLGLLPDWEGDEAWPYRNERIMTGEELLKLPKLLITLGSHSLSHKNLTKYQKNIVLMELTESKRRLEELLCRPVYLFACPFGQYNNEVLELTKQAGYRHAFNIKRCVVSIGSLPFLLGRFSVNLNEWRIEFWLKIRGAYSWL